MAKRKGKKKPRFGRLELRVDLDHPLIQLAERLDWDELLELVDEIRRAKLKSAAGRPPQLRALTGALLLRSTRTHPYRDVSDLIQHFAPARFLCGLTEGDWSPAKSTICDFLTLLGEDGVRQINDYLVKVAVQHELADPNHLAADTTAQEAAIPHPNEMGLMSSFLRGITKAGTKVGGALKTFLRQTGSKIAEGKTKLREYRLFAKTTEHKTRLMRQMVRLTGKIQRKLEVALREAQQQKEQLVGYQKVALRKAAQLSTVVKALLPQILSWLKTGFVAANKIISLDIPQLYSIVRGKVGKKVEFGLNWGVSRLRGGYIRLVRAKDKCELADSRYAVKAVKDHQALFRKVPRSFAYDRGAGCPDTFERVKKLGVRHIGIAPRGKRRWRVAGKMKARLISERAQVEGSIGAIKSSRYRFTKPLAKSEAMMGTYGQAAALGFNANKLVRDLRRRDDAGRRRRRAAS
jgi:hypothetical protein